MSLQAKKFDLNDKPKPIFLGAHGGLSIWNDGAASVFMNSGQNSPPAEWIKSGEAASYDNMEDKQLWLSCDVGLTTTIRIQTFGESTQSRLTEITDLLSVVVKILDGFFGWAKRKWGAN